MAIYNLSKTVASTPITTSASFQNHPPNINISLVPTNLEMEQLHPLNRLEQLRHIDQRSSNQLIFIPHLEPIEPRATLIVVRQGVTYPQGTWHVKSVSGPSERSQVSHHRPVSRGNQGVTDTKNYKNKS